MEKKSKIMTKNMIIIIFTNHSLYQYESTDFSENKVKNISAKVNIFEKKHVSREFARIVILLLREVDSRSTAN